MKKLHFLILLLIFCTTSFGKMITTVGPTPYDNLQQDNIALLFEYHRQTVVEKRQFFTYPRRNDAFIKNFSVTEINAFLFYSDSASLFFKHLHNYGIAVSPKLSLSYKNGEFFENKGTAFDGALHLRGYADSLDFDFNVRIFSIDKYRKHERYRGHFGFNYAWVRMSLAHDVLHWGPGYYNNLLFNQYAIPYNMLNLDMTLGPLHIFSVYVNLDENNQKNEKPKEINLYSHRYELALKNLTLGISEIQVLYSKNKPWLFVPIVPLFIEKGNYTELVNNGAISIDLNYRLFQFARFYCEFFLDDMESPIALYKNKYSNNRWAFMFGTQIAQESQIGKHLLQLGSISEIARIEPFTYCHYDYAPALMANQGRPIGNPNGPNSLTIDWTLYGKFWINRESDIFLGVHNKWAWKGTDQGSNIFDSYKTVKKHFIRGTSVQYSLIPILTYRGKFFSFTGEYSFFGEKNVYIRLMIVI